jgi:hypothetical protein
MRRQTAQARRFGTLAVGAIAVSLGCNPGPGSEVPQPTQADQQAPSPAQDVAPRIDVSQLGPQAGERVPAFSLRDQRGQLQTIESVMGPRGLMLVFVRSANW